MPSSSVIFDPEIDDRKLDKEISKVDDAFADTGSVQPEVGDVQGAANLDGVGGVGDGGGIGPGGTAVGRMRSGPCRPKSRSRSPA